MPTYYASTIEETIRLILSDITLFPIGSAFTYSQIKKKVKNALAQSNFIDLPNNSREFNYRLSKILQVHNNNRNNQYYDNQRQFRDLSRVLISPLSEKPKYMYTFGSLF